MPAAKAALAEIYNAEGKAHAQAAAKVATEFGAKWPKAAAKITDDLDVLLAFYDYPTEHWVHLRTTNPIESAQTRLRAVNAPHLVPLVRAGAIFKNGKLVERADDQDQRGGDQQAA